MRNDNPENFADAVIHVHGYQKNLQGQNLEEALVITSVMV